MCEVVAPAVAVSCCTVIITINLLVVAVIIVVVIVVPVIVVIVIRPVVVVVVVVASQSHCVLQLLLLELLLALLLSVGRCSYSGCCCHSCGWWLSHGKGFFAVGKRANGSIIHGSRFTRTHASMGVGVRNRNGIGDNLWIGW